LSVAAWHKYDQPVFSKANGVYGPGHNGFFKSPDGTEDWLIYHGNASELEGCSGTRSLRAQKFTWHDDGTPNFGEPVAAGESVVSPAGENGPLVTQVQGTRVNLVSRANDTCVQVNSQGEVDAASCTVGDAANWNLDYTTEGKYRLVNSAGLFLTAGGAQCVAANTVGLSVAPWHNQACQEWQVQPHLQGWVSLINAQTQAELRFADCTEATPKETKKSVEDVPLLVEEKQTCVQWRIAPTAEIAITSTQSGKTVTLVGTNVEQDEWRNGANQRWHFVAAEEGYFYIESVAKPKQCIAIAQKSVVPGSNAEVAACAEQQSQWQVEFLVDGTVKLANRKSNLVLDLANGGLANHTNFAQAQWLNSHSQRFQLKPIQ